MVDETQAWPALLRRYKQVVGSAVHVQQPNVQSYHHSELVPVQRSLEHGSDLKARLLEFADLPSFHEDRDRARFIFDVASMRFDAGNLESSGELGNNLLIRPLLNPRIGGRIVAKHLEVTETTAVRH